LVGEELMNIKKNVYSTKDFILIPFQASPIGAILFIVLKLSEGIIPGL